MKNNNSFFAMVSRMKYIDRWQLMRNTKTENLSEHSHFVACVAHALVLLHNKKFGKTLNADRAAVLALYHDMPEIITGDMPTPVKYFNDEMKKAYDVVEKSASERLIEMLPDDLKEEYQDFFYKNESDSELWKYVKAADKMSALVKCVEEEKAGNEEFLSAGKALEQAIRDMKLPVVDLFMEKFYSAFSKTLDEQNPAQKVLK